MAIASGTPITGGNGTLKTGASGGAYGTLTEYKVKNVNLTISGGAIDVTDSGDGNFRSKVPHKRAEWNGSAEAILKAGDTELAVNTKYSLAVVAEDTSGDEIYWLGDAIITEIGVAIPIEGEDAVSRSINFVGAGSIAKVDNTAS